MIKDSGLIDSAVNKWNLDYLGAHLNCDEHTVYKSPNSTFKYWDEKKLKNVKNFIPPTEILSIKFNEFLNLIQSDGGNFKYAS